MALTPKPGRLAFEPEDEAHMQARFDEALSPRYNVFKATGSDAPSKKRQHVFDFHDQVRMVVSIDINPQSATTFLHASFSGKAGRWRDHDHWVKDSLERLSSISGRFLPKPNHILGTPTVMHFFYEPIELGLEP